jgi:hypothetical protein
MTRTGNPGRIVRVGWLLSWRWTTCWPVWLMLLEAPLRIACTRLFLAGAGSGAKRGVGAYSAANCPAMKLGRLIFRH